MDEIQKLYDALSKSGYYTKSFDDFKIQFQDKTYQDKVFNVVSRDGLYTKSKDEFLTKYSPLPQEDTSKKKVSSVVSTTGGEVGISEPPLRKEKVLDYLKSLKSPATIVSVGKEPIVSREEVILPVQRPKKIDTNFGLTKERVQKDISPKVEEISIDIDPINLAQTKAAQTKNLQEKQDYLTASDIYSQISIPSGYEAMMAASSPDLKKETATNQILLKRANQYKEETQGLRDIKVPDLFSANDEYIEANVMPQIERAAVKWKIKQNPSFEKELKAVGANIDTDDMQAVLGTAKMGSVMDEFLDSPSVASFAKSEDPNLSIALQYAKDNNLKRNTEWGITSVANKVSREFEKSEQRRNPVAAFATESLKKDLDDVAKETLKPEEYRIYNDYIKGREEEYLDTPSFLQGFAEHGRSTLEGFANTIGKLTGVKEKDIIRERWKKEASNVSADPEGWRKFFSESGKISGLVATLAATGGVLRGAGMGAGLTAKTAGNVGDAVNISTAFLGDMIDDAVYKYPGEPVKQTASATFNTLLFMAMGRDIFPAAKVKSAFTAIKPEVEKVVSNLTNGSITREVARQEMNTLAKKAINIAGEGMAQNTKVAAELTGLGMLNEGLDVVMDMDEDKMRKYYPQGVHGDTFKSMFLGNALVSAVAGYGKYKAKNDIAKEAIYEAASNPKRYERIINDLSIKDPNVTKEELLGNLAFAVETKRLLDQRGLNEKQQKDYLLKALGERAAIAEKEKIADSNLKKEAEERIKQAQAEKDAILAGEEVAEEPRVVVEDKRPIEEIALDFKNKYNKGEISKGEYKGGRNLGVFDFEDKIIKVVKEKRQIPEDQVALMQERLGDMSNVYFPKKSIDLGEGKYGVVMEKAKGVDASRLTKEDIENIPKEHWDKLEADVRELSKRGAQVDLTKRDNLFYDKNEGFSFIDIEGVSVDKSPTNKFFVKDGVEYYFPFERYPLNAKRFEGGRKMFENIKPVESVEEAAPQVPPTPRIPKERAAQLREQIKIEEVGEEVAPDFTKKSDKELEERMASIEEDKSKRQEYNAIEKEMEARERASVFNVPLEKVSDSIDALIKKEKEMPYGYGTFIEMKDAREVKRIAEKYLNPKEITDSELKKDFISALRGNPTTWYADGLKLRESLKEATARGIDTKELINDAIEVYTKAGYDFETARDTVALMLKPVFEGSTVAVPELPATEQPAPITEEELPFGETAPREVKETKEETNLKKRALNIEPLNPLVEVMQYFISGGKVSPEAIEQLFGKERRTGMGKINVEERKSRTSLTNKTAPGIEALAEKLAGVDRTDQFREFRDAIEEVLLNHSGTKSMSEELVKDYDIDYQEQKRLAELEDINKDVEEETRLIVSQIPEAQQEEILRVLDKFRDNQGFIDWRAIAREYEGGFEPVLLELSPESQKIIENAINQIKETGRVSGISAEALPAEAKAGDILRRAAEATRTGKISKLGGFRAGTGFDAVWDASLEVIAKALEGGASVADAIEQGLKYAKSTGWYKKLTNKEDFDNKYRNHLKEQYDAIQEPTAGEVPVQPKAGVSEKVEAGVPPTEPPKTPKEGEGTREERKKRLLNNIVTSPNVPESLKKQVEEKGLSYLPATQEEATRLANAIIDSIGIDAAVEAASRNEFTDVFGGVNTAVLTEAASRLTADPVRQAQIFDILDRVLRSKGQDISYMNEFYTKNPLGVVIYQNDQRKQEFSEFAEGKEKQWKEAHDILKSENEALKKELEDLKKKPEAEGVKVAKAKAAAARQKRAALIQKYRQNKGGGLTLSAGGLSKEGIEFVGEVALTYIQEGIANVEVIIQKVTADIKDALGKEPSDDIKSEIDQIARKKFQEKKGKGVIDRLKKKLEGLTDKEKEDVIRKSYKKLIESGALEFDDFKNIVADVIGKGPLSEADANKLKDLTKKINELEAKALEAQDKRTPEAIAAYRQAELEAAKAGRELSQMFNTKPNILKRITSIIQLSTLGVPSLVVNVAYNIVNQIGLRAPIGVINSLIDRSISGTARMMGKRINPETNVFSRQTQREFFNKLNLGLREAGEQALTGLNRQDYIQKEIYGQQIQPLESMKALYRFARGKQRLSTQEVIDKGLQASVGIPAEVVARLLNLGDKPLRFAAEGATAAEFAKALGVTGIDYNLFIMFPKAEAMRVYKNQGFSEKEAEQKADYIEKSIIKEGKRATFQQDNFLNDKLQQLFGSEKSGVGDFFKTLIVSPYIKIPSNAYWSYFNLAHPDIALMQAMVYGGRAFKLKAKDPAAAKMALREARYWFAHAAVGFAYVGAISSMVNGGVFTPGTTAEESKKEREGRMYYGKPGSTNVTKLMSWLRGEDPTRIKGGYEIQNKWAGHIGTIGNAIARRELDLTPEQRKNRYMFVWELLNSLPKETLDELQEGIFSNTSSLFNALQSDLFTKRWALNTIGMLTNVVHPAALAQLSRAELPYYSTTKADSFMDEIKNSFLQRSSTLREVLGKQPPAKIGVWGDKLEKKDNLMMRWFGISKLNPDNFAQPLYNDFVRTGNSAYFPPAIKPEIEDEGKVTKLSAKQTQELEMLVGQARKNLVSPLLNDEVKIGDYGYWSEVEDYFKGEENAKEKADEIKLNALKVQYEDGFEMAKQSFLDEHPEFRGEKDKAEVKRKSKAMESVRKQNKKQ